MADGTRSGRSRTKQEQIITGFTPINAPKQAIAVTGDPPTPRPWFTKKRKRGKSDEPVAPRQNNARTRAHKSNKNTERQNTDSSPPRHSATDSSEQIVVETDRDNLPHRKLDQQHDHNMEESHTTQSQHIQAYSTTAAVLPSVTEEQSTTDAMRRSWAKMFTDEIFSDNSEDDSFSMLVEPTSGALTMATSSDTIYEDSGDEFGSIDDDDLVEIDSNLKLTSSAWNQRFVDAPQHVSSDIPYQNWSTQNRGLLEVTSSADIGPLDSYQLDFGRSGNSNDTLIDISDHMGVSTMCEISDAQRRFPIEQVPHRRPTSKSAKKQFKSPFVRKPFVRPKQPMPVRDRSPISGISAATTILTCFRIGEVYNFGSSAVKNNKSLIIELYARVALSERETTGVKQNFVFWDIFHDKPPYITGYYNLWKGNDLWDYESGQFIEISEEKKLCRCICRAKKDDNNKLELMILNIWEASWDDVEYVKGILMA